MHTMIYVSPKGEDWWTGHLPVPTDDGQDGPIKSLRAALRRARHLRRDGAIPGPVTIWLDEGRYPLSFPLELGAEDYGSCHIRAYPDTQPVIDGGIPIVGWTPCTFNDRPAWRSDVTSLLLEFGPFRSLFVNGQRAQRARWPSEDVLWIERAPDVPASFGPDTTTELVRGQSRFIAHAGDLDAIPDWYGAEVAMLNRWVHEWLPVKSYDSSTRTVTLKVPTRLYMRTEYADTKKTTRYWIENVSAGFLKSGDWYLDERERVCYYLPRDGETPDTVEIVAPVLQQWLRIMGTPDQPAGGLRFTGITFRHADWQPPCNRAVWWDPYRDASEWAPCDSFRAFKEVNHADPRRDAGTVPQAAFNLPGAIHLEYARDCVFTRCCMEHTGYYAIGFGRGCRGHHLDGNTLMDLGAGGIIMNGDTTNRDPSVYTGHSQFINNRIHGGGQVFRAGCGIAILNAERVTLAHNEIFDQTYSGISCGWEWGFTEQVSRAHCITKNHIHHIGQRGGMSDMGGIYLLGPQPGTLVDGNFVHDIACAAYGGFGIYPDEGSSFLIIQNNVVWRVRSDGLHDHMGRQNVIRNNIFACCGEHGVCFARPPRNRWVSHPPEGGLFLHNIVVSNGAPVLFESLAYQSANPYACDLNCYWDLSALAPAFRVRLAPDIQACAKGQSGTLADRQQAGQDTHSIAGNPLFADLASGDFHWPPASPAAKLGIRPIDLSDVGPQPKSEQ